ncbi:50S ribosomal protein L10 [Candidatus Saccharibacteria bacterium]|nr:50S ribosomal protein L10 [Candidatus Saccharibacteria bacterium]
MAITRAKKEAIITEIKDLLSKSKLTVVADYEGLPVDQFQTLRAKMERANVTVRVVKNRLVLKALEDLGLKSEQISLSGMMVYVFNPEDEVRGAQIIKAFVKKTKAALEFVGAITETGHFMSKEEVVRLSGLPSKTELIASVVYSLKAPAGNTIAALSGGLPAMLTSVKSSKS